MAVGRQNRSVRVYLNYTVAKAYNTLMVRGDLGTLCLIVFLCRASFVELG
jgi:hypothetical protein